MTSQDSTQAGGFVEQGMLLADDVVAAAAREGFMPGGYKAACDALRAHLAAQSALAEQLAGALENLFATVMGECRSLLDEDSGGNSGLYMEIVEVLEAHRAQKESRHG